MRRKAAIIVALLVLLTAAVTSVSAIIWGGPDGQAHPYVGLVVFDVDGRPSHRCSGTLISPTVFLTAGHCTSGADAARVWFETAVTDPAYPFSGGTSIPGTPYTHPDFNGFAGFPNTSDVGVVVLDAPAVMGSYGALPAIGAVDAAYGPGRRHLMNIVGYGVQGIVPNPNTIIANLVRYQGDPKIVELNSANTGGWNIHLSSNPGQGNGSGGACFGDSGGPALLSPGSNVVGGVGSFVLNLNCTGAGFYYRVDTAHALNFITSFLP